MFQTFYQTIAQLCFTLLGLWWLVLQTKYREWIGHRLRRRMGTYITFYFLLPGTMGVVALLAADARLLWQIAFVLCSLAGMVATTRFMGDAMRIAWVNRSSAWLIQGACGCGLLLYALVVLVAALPDVLTSFGVIPLMVAGALVTLLVLVGLTLAWTYFVEPFPDAKE